MIPQSSIACHLAALEALPILPCIQRYMGYFENPCLCISGPPLSTRAVSQPFARVLRPSLLAKRSRRLSAGYIWTSTGAQGCRPPANRMAQYPTRAPHMELVRQYPWVASAVDWLEETTPSASVWPSVQLFSSSSRRDHGRKRQPQAPIGANAVDSSTAGSGVTLFSYRPVL
jgi:hypothetical protein